jgi:shikimate dehydrogenase
LPPESSARTPRTTTRAFALLGDPVSHSLSPRLHNAAFASLGLDATYGAVRCKAADVAERMRAHAGGNVTVPHKRVAAEAVARASNAVRATGACNTFWTERGVLRGDNTDVVGFERALRELIGSPQDAHVLLLGAGGAASAALFALLGARVAHVTVVNRSKRKAKAMIERVAPHESRVTQGIEASDRAPFDLVVNATTLGMRADDPPPVAIDPARFDAVFDMVYSPAGTAWVRAARAAGIPASDGKPMLLYQAAAAFERWWDRPAPLDVMRAALEEAG